MAQCRRQDAAAVDATAAAGRDESVSSSSSSSSLAPQTVVVLHRERVSDGRCLSLVDQALHAQDELLSAEHVGFHAVRGSMLR